MGLDMYLEAKRYIQNWDHNPPEKRYRTTVVNGLGEKLELPCEPTEIVCQIGYWRKANHIHNWFVQNVQNQEDDCREHYVPREKLQELLSVVEKVLASTKLVDGTIRNGATLRYGQWKDNMEQGLKLEDPSVAIELLPTAEGFFFGGQDYDEYYWQDLLDTQQIIIKALALDDKWSIEYNSSW